MKNRAIVVALLTVLLVAPWMTSEAHAGQYLVRGTFIDPGVLAPPDVVVKMSEDMVFPSLAMLDQWAKDGKIVGGVVVGDKQGLFMVEAPSNADVDKMIQGLPFWALLKWEVTPLITFGDRLGREKEMIAQMKARQKK